MAGPLAGIKVIELAGIGPGPFCAMLLADLGADVLRVDRADKVPETFPDKPADDLLLRSRRSVGVNLKAPEGVETVLRLVDVADVIMEGFRPGVMERLGLGPDTCLARNPRIVYARMTGWGQQGPMAHSAGHDINYIALAGALAHIGRAGEKPAPPLNLVGDFGGGGMLQAFGIACALVERAGSGRGQVIDTAMVDGAATLMTMFHTFWNLGALGERGKNLLDGGAHFYDTYECSDGNHVALGSIEPQFYAELIQRLGLEGETLPQQMDRSGWEAMHEKLEAIFKTKSRSEWCELLEGTDVCFAPVLTIPEAAEHPHNLARETFVDVAGVRQPAPAPRFSRSQGEIQSPPAHPGQHTDEALVSWGFDREDIKGLRDMQAIA